MQPENIISSNTQTNTTTEFSAGATNQTTEAPQTTPINPGKDIVFRDKPKKNVGAILGVILLILLAAGGAGFGTWAYLSGNQQQEQLNSRINELNQQNNELQEKLNNASNTNTNTNNNPTEAVNTENYIYVGEWGYKIKIPENFSSVSYRYSYESGYTKVTIWGVDCSNGKCQYFPDYANVNKNDSGLGSIARYPKGTTFNEGPAPQLVFSDDDYDYYYYHIQVAYSADSNDEEEIKWEGESIDIVTDMLMSPNSYSKF